MTDPGRSQVFVLTERQAASLCFSLCDGLLHRARCDDPLVGIWSAAIDDLLEFAADVDEHLPHGKYQWVTEFSELIEDIDKRARQARRKP